MRRFCLVLLAAGLIAGSIAFLRWQDPRGWKDSEIECLAMALYRESALAEPFEGLLAIAATIKNRVRSRDFPGSICEVVMQGGERDGNGGCQFSFYCDGLPDLPKNRIRWVTMKAFAEAFIVADPPDVTGGATHYFAHGTVTPQWYQSDMEKPCRVIGSHTFCRSWFLGRDILAGN